MDLDPQYFTAARSWETDRELMRERSELRAWWVAGGATLTALAAVAGLALLAPYRRNVPYLFALDRTSGNVEFIGTVDDRTIKGYQEMLDKFWLRRYVIAHESYFYRFLQEDYDTVLALSTEDVGKDFSRIYDGPNARDKTYGSGIEIKVTVLSIQVATNAVGQHATVRFSKVLRRIDSNVAEPAQYFVAAMTYTYKPTMFGKEQELLKNPLGFQTTAYRVDSELAPIEASGGNPAAAPSGE
ncbi:type IV secretion system protein [Duganella sp. BJB1802]|uniref:virB8 family protein n=1 Tax=Duganella sp. BJB1802 TaxID=2744575 RepID=UPI0015945E7A|nr:type IV secretion system protein [Duganella sp. BJB1802]NVD69580.1 type IV secretion system protein [Duganella sp. BJB1802]